MPNDDNRTIEPSQLRTIYNISEDGHNPVIARFHVRSAVDPALEIWRQSL
jgi:hypothetical protein